MLLVDVCGRLLVSAFSWLRWCFARLLHLLPSRRLNASGKQLTVLPRVGGGTRELLCAHNRIVLPPSLVPWCNLTVLDLGSNGLKTLPASVGFLAALQSLNLAHNSLSTLPPEIGRLRALRVLGLRSNLLTALPDQLGDLEQLESLFLTDNRLTELPRTMGRLLKLRKLQAASNALTSLPEELGECASLEMLRLPCNALAQVPRSLSAHPRLCWLSLSGNARFCAPPAPAAPVPSVAPGELLCEDEAPLGPSGASGGVCAALWRGRRVALKRFVSGVSPDGAPTDEVAAACAVRHGCVVAVLAVQQEPLALLMSLAPGQPLGGRPCAASLLRCTYPAGAGWTSRFARTAARDVAAGLAGCHAVRVAHGDVYAHNVVVDSQGRATLVDMGAAWGYPQGCSVDFERLEVRAFGLLLHELAQRTQGGVDRELGAVAQACLQEQVDGRPCFRELERSLQSSLLSLGDA